MTARLTICVDDFGLDPGINAAVLQLARQGRVSATSCMTGAPHWRSGAPALRELDAGAFEAGLHLDLTGFPFNRSLRRPLSGWLLRSYLRAVPRPILRAEIEAQLDAFEAQLRCPPDHVDGHEHVHQLPVVRELLLDVLRARYPGRKLWLRSTRRAASEGARKAWVIQALGNEALVRLADDSGFRLNRHLLGVYDFTGDAPHYLALLGGWLAAAGDRDLLMCHAGDNVQPGVAFAKARQIEYQVLSSSAFGELLARFGVRLMPLSHALGQ
jgi:chitin disaccharide deacetylase